MNENSSNSSTSASHHGLSADAISRRAYELWEQEGRPENRDLHHWLRAEQELRAEQSKSSGQPKTSAGVPSRDSDWLSPEKDLLQQNKSSNSAAGAPVRSQNTDQPLQGNRTATPGRDPKSPGKRTAPPAGSRPPGRS